MTGRKSGFRFLALLLAALFLSSCSSDKKQPPRTQTAPGVETANTPAGAPQESAGTGVPPGTDATRCTVAPGSTRTFTLSGPLPFIHGTERSSGLEAEYGLAVNDWAQGGMEVAVDGTRLSSETFQVWTVAHETRNMKTDGTGAVRNPVDITGNPNLHAGARGAESADILVETGRTREFIEQGNMSEYEIKEFWEKNHKTLVLLPIETRPYAFYRFDVAFTVSVPDEGKLEEIDKSSRNDQVSLVFWPGRVVFNDGVRTEERAPAKDRHNVRVLVSLSRKPGGGYHDLLFRSVSPGYELRCD